MNLRNLQIDKSWTLFLDRDGVINRRIVGAYARRWDEFEFLPGATLAIAAFSRVFGRLVVVTNQQGVGKGLMTIDDVVAVHRQMVSEIEKSGGRIDSVFFSPHLSSDHNFNRKPGLGMALQARKKFPEIRFKKSLMAGDSLSDMIFGKRCGMKTAMIADDHAAAKCHPRLIDFVYPDLISLAREFDLSS